ncbi:Neopullulanase 2 [Paenibacillus mucilaginosus 3016]|uniref:Neopullulanase 2 n=1 Tax=Paenibacillus mucilaginosus 3016 TaxID=1116391 RepID=H6NFQ3_9BACL|nr:alpha-glycosidase [Paenibacillus mucilaginosus]AFC30693.1 Neopullulanase 2 [Paenibacillus mucilaginosus 3016]WFA19303.1 alpha-glycosidase [Paenibacillus mucilaginosus]
MNLEAIYHIDDIPYAFAVRADAIKVRIRAKRGEVVRARVLHSDRYVPYGHEVPLELELAASTAAHDYFEGLIQTSTFRVRYLFLLEDAEGRAVWYGELGASVHRDKAGLFHFPYLNPSNIHEVPDWIHDAVVYQIFPERFCNGDPANDPPLTEAWTPEARPRPDSWYGGDLAGIRQKLPYLQELGVTLMYLTPVFLSPSTHKYDISDYLKIDPQFGDMELLRTLVAEAHALGIRVMLDAVFNHSGQEFFAFRDLVEKGENSSYRQWFYAEGFPVTEEPEANYLTFATGIKTMPKLRTSDAELAQYLLEVAAYWIRETGIDGWRLDVANEVDMGFWRGFRQKVKSVKPDALIIGEIMHHAGPWLRGDQFDGVMNYVLREALVDFFAKQAIGVREFSARLALNRMMHSDAANQAMFNLIGSHDTDRFLTLCERHGLGWNDLKYDVERLRLAVFFLMTYTGMPMIYYGDEVGMRGGYDPDCRRPMIWDEEAQDRELFGFFRTMIALRRRHRALRRGTYRSWLEEEALGVLGYIRDDGTEQVLAVLNHSPNPVELELELPAGRRVGGMLADALSGAVYTPAARQVLALPPFGCMLLVET